MIYSYSCVILYPPCIWFSSYHCSQFKTNTVGPIHTTNAFLPLLRSGTLKKCITITSTVGSPQVCNTIGLDTQVPYAISKAAVNLAIAKFAARYRDEGIVFLGITPGMVRTMQWCTYPPTCSRSPIDFLITAEEEFEKFLGPITAKLRQAYPHFEGPITTEKSVKEMLGYIQTCTIADSGKLVHRDGRDFNSL